MAKEEIDDIVEGTIMEMGLQECSDRLIGNWHLRGISGGEKKRLSIALEILIRPQLLFLDEPTSGLDSAAAFFVIQTLRNIARDGRTVISSVHQPSSEVFALFDDLFLLSGGETVYFGEAKMAVEVQVYNQYWIFLGHIASSIQHVFSVFLLLKHILCASCYLCHNQTENYSFQ